MREDDFKCRYDALQRSISASEELKERTRRAIAEEQARIVDSSAEHVSVLSGKQRVEYVMDPTVSYAANSNAKPRIERVAEHATAPSAPTPSLKAIPKRRKVRKLAIIAAAACLVVGLAVFGFGAPFFKGANMNEDSFSVVAYAATTETAFNINEEDMIVFPIDRRSGEFSGAAGADEFYSGALFTVEGEGIERVQATLSRGEIYSYKVEDFLVADNPEKAAEAGAWASKLVGTGKYYKDYDAVARIGNPDASETDPYAHVRMLKRLGSTIDVPIEEGSPNCWGLWLDVDSVANTELHEKIRDVFVDLEAMEGETLTVTAQMADGTFQTQVIELHAGWFKGESVTGVMGLADVLPTGKPVSFDEVTPDGNFVHALYGTLQSASNTPHPYSLADANRYANEVAPTKGGIENVLEFQGTTTVLEGVPEPETAADADGIVVRRMTIYDGARSRENREVAVRLSGLRCEVTDKLPGCFDLHEDTQLAGFSGNIEYMNKCRMITSHYAVDEKGALNEGNSFVIVEYDLLNEGDEEIFIGAPVGALCAVDEQGAQTVFATSGVFSAIDAGWHDTANGDRALRGVWLKSGESNHVTVAYVAEDSVAHAEKLALMVSPDESFLRYGYEGELPNVHDLQFVWLRS